MNIAVKHDGTTITSRVISYEREHRICTSVGTLEIVLEGTYNTAINPWDTFDIYENGSFKVRYYVSNVSSSLPDGTIVVQCQDKSKRLVDYFIPKSYTIDYPSYTRYWIQKFLTEAGISYSFTTASQGNLLSNYTTLGLTSGYDQIMMLLQLSGWYMYFNGTGTAVIGTLDEDLSQTVGSLGKHDILDIKRVTDDKMLRNRAVVWGQFDPLRQEYAYADVSTHTRWNYDHRDLRTMVISNNNIPDKTSAYGIANKLLKEFSRATIEKHIVAHGARNYSLGKSVQVNSSVWRGKGMITTFGVSMSRSGLVTNLILDERCPRLFGFFNFGDYVYVSTFGDGVWRKHIRFDPAWYNFSSGLTNLEITDLHINNAIFGSVGSNGELFYANSEAGGWGTIVVDSLESSVDDNVPSGTAVTYQPYSGIMGRATIVDRTTNNIKFVMDTFSGLNTGDYFMTYSGLTSFSGVISSGYRGWLAEYDPFTGQPVGGLGSGIYPINFSGCYDIIAFDVENDGVSDYVSVRAGIGAGVIPHDEQGRYDFGYHITQPFASTKDKNSYSIAPSVVSYVNTIGDSAGVNISVANENALIANDNTISGERMVMAVGKDRKARLYTFHREWDEINHEYNVYFTTIVSSSGPDASVYVPGIMAIRPTWSNKLFRVFYKESSPVAFQYRYYYTIWDGNNDTWSTPTLVGTQSREHPVWTNSSPELNRFLCINNKIYHLHCYVAMPFTGGGVFSSESKMYVYLYIIDMQTGLFEQRKLITFTTVPYASGTYERFPDEALSDNGTSGQWLRSTFGIFQKGDTEIQIIGWVNMYGHYVGLPDPPHSIEYLVKSNGLVTQYGEIYNGNVGRFYNGVSTEYSQLDLNIGFIGMDATPGGDGFFYNGTVFDSYTNPGPGLNTPVHLNKNTIFPVLNGDKKYIAKDTATNKWYLCSASNLSVMSEIVPPTNTTLIKPFSTPVKNFANEIYWLYDNWDVFDRGYVPYNFSSFDVAKSIYPDYTSDHTYRAINFGNLFITSPIDYSAVSPYASVAYIDMGEPDYGASYLILRRDGSDFDLIRAASKPLRIDISNNSPVLSALDFENTFQASYVYGNSLTQVIPFSGLQYTRDVQDYRYTLLETSSGVIASGVGVSNQILYVNGSGLYMGEVSFSGGFTLIDDTISGLNRIETSNYVYPGQYIFATTSGENPAFYQKDYDSFYFDSYSGLPSSRATMIRLDDRF